MFITWSFTMKKLLYFSFPFIISSSLDAMESRPGNLQKLFEQIFKTNLAVLEAISKIRATNFEEPSADRQRNTEMHQAAPTLSELAEIASAELDNIEINTSKSYPHIRQCGPIKRSYDFRS